MDSRLLFTILFIGFLVIVLGLIDVIYMTTQRPVVQPGRQATITTIRLDGASYVKFNVNRLPSKYLTPVEDEEFSLWFLTNKPDGLIWYQKGPKRSYYIAMKNGYLVFVNDDRNGAPQQVEIGKRSGRRYDDYAWHRLKLRRNGQRIRLTVDNRDQEEYVFSDNIKFLTNAEVWLGGTPNTFERTDGNVNTNFDGSLAEVIYVTINRVGQHLFRNEVNLMDQLSKSSTTGDVSLLTIPNPFGGGGGGGGGGSTIIPLPQTTRYPPFTFHTRPPTTTTRAPPRPQTTSMTINQKGVVIPVPSMTMRSGSSISFSFKTINQNGLILFAGDARSQYIAVELVDGRLYFVHDFGQGDRRTPFSQRIVADGQNHEVEMRFYPTHVDLRLDYIRERVAVSTVGETQPSNLGTMYVAGFPNYQQLPWMVWSRESYLGCLSDLRVDSRYIDFETYIQQLFGRVTRGCQAMPQDCTTRRPCASGLCRNTMMDFFCDCSRTAFRGERCNLDAWTALLNGSVYTTVDFSNTLKTHTDDLSFRFRSPLKDGLLFKTFARGTNAFLRCSLANGRIKVETNLGGQLKSVYTGENLNDFNWHTVYIQRRGNELQAWLDDEPHTKITLEGTGYSMDIDRIYIGGTDGSLQKYIGYLQNFYLGDVDFLQELRGTGLEVNSFVSLPPLVYYPVSFPEHKTYVELPPLRVPLSMALHFMFRTKESSGVLLFSSGRDQDYLAAELLEGRMFFNFNTGAGRPLRATVQKQVNDGKWHAVTIRRIIGDRRQFKLVVDGMSSSVSYTGVDELDLRGPLYIGGAPQELLQKDYIKNGLFSRAGFRGCLASMDLSGNVPDLKRFAQAQGVVISNDCQDLAPVVCFADLCKNHGVCVENGTGSFICDCNMSAHKGAYCENEPLGYRYQNFNKPGLLIYTFPQQPTTSRDEIAFGVMTKQNNAVLMRVFSDLTKDFIEFRLRDGYGVVEYNTDTAGGKTLVSQTLLKISDGKYHTIRFIRTPFKSTFYVDMAGVSNVHGTHGNFDRMSTMYIGGGYDVNNKLIMNGYDGIIGGLYINGLMAFPQAEAGINTDVHGDVVIAPTPYTLTVGG